MEIKQINKEILKEIIAKTGFDYDLLTKDYYITILLYLIKDIKGLYFKGGTALQLTLLEHSRISEDIDFTLTRPLKEIKKEIKNIISKSKIFGNITQDKDVDGFVRLVVYYKSILGDDQIFIDLNARGKLFLKPEQLEMKHFYPNIPSFKVPCLNRIEMVAEKVAAAIGRNKPRDHYDIYQIIKHDVSIDMDLVKKKCKQSRSDPSILKMFNRAKKLHGKWDSDMIPLLVEEISFQEVMQTLANYFNLKEEKALHVKEEKALHVKEEKALHVKENLKTYKIINCNKILNDYCTKKGYYTIKINPDRYLTGIIKRKGKLYFFKHSINENLNLQLLNEIRWNELINSIADAEGKPYHCPTIIDKGNINGRPYGVFEFFSEENCFSKDRNTQLFESYLPRIIDFIFWLRQIKIDLPLDKNPKFSSYIDNIKEKIITYAISYTQDIDRQFKGLLEVIKNTTFKNLKLAHVEIKPDHLFEHNGKLGIIDAEWASNCIPEHYDLVSCYARVFSKFRSPVVANKLLREYYNQCKKNGLDISQFVCQFRGLLALRAIGEYRDAFKSGKIYPEYEELINNVLNNKFPFN